MKCVCPYCFATFSAEAMSDDQAARRIMDFMSKEIPLIIQNRLFSYIALFRTSARGVAWPKVERLVQEIGALVKTPTHSWDGKKPLPTSPEVWATAMDKTIENRPQELQNHNYLRHVAYDLADPDSRRKRPTQTTAAPTPATQHANSEAYVENKNTKLVLATPMTDEQRKMNQEKLKELMGKICPKSLPERNANGRP